MSRSETYRSAHLTSALRTQLGRASRGQRLAEIVPVLREHLAATLQASSITGHGHQQLDRRVASSTSIAELRSFAVELDRLATEGGSGPRTSLPSHPLQPATMAKPAISAAAACVRFDAVALAAERDSMIRVASSLSLDLSDLGEAGRALDQASRFLDAGQTDVASQALNRARQVLAAADDRITDALAAAECRARTVDTTVAALRSMGYRVQAPVVDEAGTLVVAKAADGRQAVVDITGSGEPLGIASSFTDPGNAVPLTHADAGNACDPADRDEAALAAAIGGAGLVFDHERAHSRRGVRGARRSSRPPRDTATNDRTTRSVR